ncbi:MAG: DUF4097 family beta strand repeat-containing protein [Thermoanaerobaculia bacterium]
MKTRILFAAIVMSAFGAANAEAVLRKTIEAHQKYALEPGGTFVLENPVGDVEIVGADVAEIEADILTTVTADDDAGFQEAQRFSGLLTGGDPKMRVVRAATVASNYRQTPWSVSVRWRIRLPRSATVRVVSYSSRAIRISNILGNVTVKNFNGNVILTNLNATTIAESVNGSILYNTPRPRGNVALGTLNGSVSATVASNANIRWVAKTVKGDIRTNLPARGTLIGTTFRGSINAPGGPTITTSSLMGNVRLIAPGPVATQSVRNVPNVVRSPATVDGPQTSDAARGDLQRGTVVSSMQYATSLGDVKVSTIRGNADIFTGAGQVQIGEVTGVAKVRSLGGPLQLGEIMGALTASTRAGDILVDSTRRGGTISTEGGTISLLYTSGPTRLTSGGGDITVRQAAAPVNAETSSGDIAITIDPQSKTETIEARTGKGNVILNVPPLFRADLEATIITNDPAGDTIVSDLPGLSITREQVGGTTRVHAVGKINGGGERVVLEATGGDIRVSTGRAGPTLVKPR